MVFSLDETLIPFLGWVAIRQYLPAKPHPYGLLARVMCAGKSRFIVSFELYFGAKSTVTNDLPTILRRFCNKILQEDGKHYTLVVDNYYTTMKSVAACHSIGWSVVGTIRPNRTTL